jgi:copper chaperone CopZ
MKGVLIIILISWSALYSQAQFSDASLEASGVTCSLCSKAIKKALEGLSFVDKVNVDVRLQVYNVVFKKKSTVHIDDIRKAVEDAGFSIASLRVTGHFDNVKLQKDQTVRIGDQVFSFLNANGETLDGERTLTLIDKSFLTPKAFKKYSPAIKQSTASNIRVYHVII